MTPPIGQLEIGGGIRYSAKPLVFVEAPASDSLSGLVSVGISGDGEHWSTTSSGDRRLWDLADPQFGGTARLGTREIHVRWRDAAGNVALAVAEVAVDPGKIRRLAGADRFATAAAISKATFEPGVPVAYVAYAYDFPDALAGAAAAGRTRAPPARSGRRTCGPGGPLRPCDDPEPPDRPPQRATLNSPLTSTSRSVLRCRLVERRGRAGGAPGRGGPRHVAGSPFDPAAPEFAVIARRAPG